MRIRPATPADAAALAGIYNQVIEERTATFETSFRADEDVLAWFDGVHPIVVVADDRDAVIAFARAYAYSARECYSGVFEFAIYTEFAHRRRGAGLLALRELVAQARASGAWKLVSRIFIDNEPSRMLHAAVGFREVGIHHRHAKLDGRWRDVVVVEKFLAPVGAEASLAPPPGRAPREQVLESLRSGEAATRHQALESARSLIDVYREDQELLEALADAFFASKTRDATSRGRFVALFRAYAEIGPDAARDLDDALFARLGGVSIALDLDAFYEAAFVMKQVGASTAPYRERLLEWTREVIELPRTTRGRISPGNLTSLLMTLTLAGCESEEQKSQVAELAAEAKQRHRVEPPASVRPPPLSSPPPPPPSPPPPLPPPLVPEKKPRKKRTRAKAKG